MGELRETAMMDEHRRILDARGFAVLEAILSPGQVRALRATIDEYARARVTIGPYGLICHNPWPDVPLLFRVIEETLAPLACALLDADEVILFQDIFIGKPPGTAAVQWHQDYSYWPLDRCHGLTMWLALDHADVDNGCLRYIPGTHRLGEKRPADFFVGTSQPVGDDLPPLAAEAHADRAVDAPVAAGSLLVHHPLVWHMSPVNESMRPRHAWSLTWLLPDVRWRPEHAPHPFVHSLQPQSNQPVRGELFPRFVPDPDPGPDPTPTPMLIA